MSLFTRYSLFPIDEEDIIQTGFPTSENIINTPAKSFG